MLGAACINPTGEEHFILTHAERCEKLDRIHNYYIAERRYAIQTYSRLFFSYTWSRSVALLAVHR